MTVAQRVGETAVERPPVPSAVAPRRSARDPARRRLLVVWTVGLLLTVTVGVWLTRLPPVYSTRLQVVFLAPKSNDHPNGLAFTQSDLIKAAGLVGRTVGGDTQSTHVVSPDVTLAGEGLHRATAVTIPNSGGQWGYDFTEALLDVQVVGPSYADVTGRATGTVQQIQTTLADFEQQAQVPGQNRIRTLVSPLDPPVLKQAGSGKRAAAGIFALGLGLTAAVARRLAGAEALRLRRRRTRATVAPALT